MSSPVYSLDGLGWFLRIEGRKLKELATTANRHYHSFLIPRPGKPPRQIDNPDDILKAVQRRLYDALLKTLDMPAYIHGGVIGGSPKSNSLPHLGKSYVVKLDLKDFFPTVSDRQVYSIWQRLGYIPPVASVLTSLTTFRHHLPQGAPSSPCLANLALLDSDSEISRVAQEANCTFTRYLDDIGLSGNRPYMLIGKAMEALQRAGFRVSRPKLKIMPAMAPQEITGYLVNSDKSLSISRKKRGAIRAAIRQLNEIRPVKDFDRAVRSVRGRIQYISSTHPGNATALSNQLDRAVERYKQARKRCSRGQNDGGVS